MTEDLHDRVRQLLEEAEERSASSDAEGDGSAAEAFGDVPERANELVEGSDPGELLEAVDSDADTGEDPPETLADAIARSDADELVELRKLLTLSRMAREEDEEARAEHVEAFRELSREGDAAGADEPGRSGEDDGAGDSSPDEAGEKPSGPEEEEKEEEEETDGDDRLRESLLGEVEGFKERIRTARAELDEESEGESEDEAEEPEDAEADEEDAEADEEEAEPEASGGGRGSSGRQGTMFSTVPSHDRSDMRGPDRFSTVRRK